MADGQKSFMAPELAGTGARYLVVAAAGLAGLAAGWFVNPDQFFLSYLVGYVFWINMALGMLFLLMIQHLTGGAWGVVTRRVLEAGARTLPALAVLFVPVILGMHSLYEWTHADAVAADKILQHKAPYLNTTGFLTRAAVYFVVWGGVGLLLAAWSRSQDQTGRPEFTQRMRTLSGPGVVMYGLTVTFMSTDWFMSLEPHWFSTMYPVLFVVGQGLAAFTMTIIMVVWLSGRAPLAGVVTEKHLHDLGKLMLAFVMLWAYTNFSQFLITWSGNLREEVPWYLKRTQEGWLAVALILVIFHFALPFALLLSRKVKQNARLLAGIAGVVLVMRVLDLFWFLRPAVPHGGGDEHHGLSLMTALSTVWIDVSALAAIGGIWMFLFLRGLSRRPLLPVNDPNFEEALAHGRH